MKEAREIFYDNEFYNKLDSNPYLIGCKNCIIDIKNQTYRKGRHEDYISMSTQMVLNIIKQTNTYYR